MNTKGTKFLAVFAVFAMVVSAFAFVAPIAVDGAGSTGTALEDGAVYKITVGDGLEYTNGAVKGKTINDAYTISDLKWEGARAFGYAQLKIEGFNNIAGALSVKIIQTNTALKATQTDEKCIDESAGVKTKVYDIGNDKDLKDGDTIYFLIPQDGSSVKFEFTYYNKVKFNEETVDTDAEIKKTSSFEVNFSETYTAVSLDGNNDVYGTDWVYTKTNKELKLTNFSGNAWFSGDISTVDLSGENKITAIDASAIDAWKDVSTVKTPVDLMVRSTDGTGSLAIEVRDVGKGSIQAGAQPTADYANYGPFKALSAAGMKIKGTEVSIQAGLYSDLLDGAEDEIQIVGVAAESLYMFASDLSIELPMDCMSTGILTSDVGVSSDDSDAALYMQDSGLTIQAVNGVILEKVKVAKNFLAEKVDISIKASGYGIYAGAIKTSVAKSFIEVETAYGYLPDGYASYGIAAVIGGITNDADTVITADSILVGGGKNSATIVVGTLFVEGAFENAGLLTINDTMYLGAQFTNTGNLVNNGEIIEEVSSAGPITFAGSWLKTDDINTYGNTAVNENLGNDILVRFDGSTYYVTGTVAYHKLPETENSNGEFYKMWTTNNVANYALYFADARLDKTEDIKYEFNGVVQKDFKGDGLLLYMNEAGMGGALAIKVTISTDKVETYNIDLTGLTVAKNTTTNPKRTGVATVTEESQGTPEGTFILNGGEVDNSNGTFVSRNQNDRIDKGNFIGDIMAYEGFTMNGGAISGDILANVNLDKDGKVVDKEVNINEGTVAGKIKAATVNLGTAGKEVVIVGDIYATKAVTAGAKAEIGGNIFISGNNAGTIIVGKMIGNVVFTGKYLDKYVENSKDTDKVEYTSTVALDIYGVPITLTCEKAVDAKSASKAGVPGYIKVNATAGVPEKVETDDEKAYASTITTVDGTVQLSGEVPAGFTIVAETGTVNVASGKLTVNGALKVSEKATFNDKTVDNKYGAVESDTKYVADGYTIYCDIAFAFENAKGLTITVTKDKTGLNVESIAAGTTVVLAENVDLTFINTKEFAMGEGAKIVLGKNSYIQFADKEYSGTFEYVDTVVVFDAVKLTTATGKLVAVPATSSAAAMIKLDAISYNAGTIELVKGTTSGTATLAQVAEAGEGEGKTPMSSGKFIIDEGAVCKTKLTTCNDVVDRSKKVTQPASIVVVNGTYDTTKDAMALNGTWYGLGAIVLADEIVTISAAANVDLAFMDEDGNGYIFNEVSMYKPASDKSEGDFTAVGAKLQATAATGGSSPVAGFITLKSAATTGNKWVGYTGEIVAVGNVKMDGVEIYEKFVIVVGADATMTLQGSESEAKGLLVVEGKLNQKIKDDSETTKYVELKYEASYVDGKATVYGSVKAAAKAAPAGTELVAGKTIVVDGKLEIAPGVTIVIPEDYEIQVGADEYIVIGEAISSLGAVPAKIIGKITLADKAFIIAYAGVDLDGAEIEGETNVKIKESAFLAGKQLYADVYAGENGNGVLATKVTAEMKVKIDGFRFSGWLNDANEKINGDKIGSSSFYAKLVADQIEVTFKAVPGVTYFVDNKAMYQVDAPVSVAYGSVITAVADMGYEGTPLVNGQKYITIDDNTKEIVASGVSPVQPKQDGGMGLTDILLIVLVVLVVVLAVVVILRLNRS